MNKISEEWTYIPEHSKTQLELRIFYKSAKDKCRKNIRMDVLDSSKCPSSPEVCLSKGDD